MAKDAYYFSHDSNARTDPKILQMISVYGYEGYGWYWALIEMMREQENYELDIQGKYVFNAFALQMNTTAEKMQSYLEDCISEFRLFESDSKTFWSNSLKERMKIKDEKSEKAKKSAEARWNKVKKSNKTEDLIQPQCEGNANASKSDAIKESKVKESKVNKIKYDDYVSMTEEEYNKLIIEYGEQLIKEKIIDLNLWKGSKGKRTKSDYLTLLSWIRKDQKENKPITRPNGIKEIPKNPTRRDDF